MVEVLFLLRVAACLVLSYLEIGPAPRVDPATYRAPGGRFELRVEPSQRHGRGAARYRFLEEGKERWSGTLLFTLLSAVISDGGVVAGYWCEKGTDRSRHDDAFSLVILDAEGKTRLTETSETAAKRFGTRKELEPELHGLFIDETNDRLVVRVSDNTFQDYAESWWVYQLSTCKAKEKLGPFATPGDAASSLYMSEAKAVVGTPLTLVRWCRRNVDGDKKIGAIFTLVDLKGKPVWQLNWIDDYAFKDRGEEDANHLCYLVSSRGAILACKEPGRFELYSGAKSERISFKVQNEAGAWKVSEVGRAPYDLEGVDGALLPKIAENALKPLGAIELKVSSSAADSWIAGVELDGQDAIYAVDSRTGAISVFSGDGKFVRVIQAKESDFEAPIWEPAIAFDDAGGIFLGLGGRSPFPDNPRTFAHFSKSGERLGEVKRPASHVYPLSGGERFVAPHYEEVLMVDRDGRTVRTITHKADGRWIEESSDVAVAPDGTFAVLGHYTVDLYEASGEPIRTIELPRAVGYFHEFDYDGSRIVVLGEGRMVLFDKAGGAGTRLTAEGWKWEKNRIWRPFLAAKGAEVWVFDGDRNILKYALP